MLKRIAFLDAISKNPPENKEREPIPVTYVLSILHVSFVFLSAVTSEISGIVSLL